MHAGIVGKGERTSVPVPVSRPEIQKRIPCVQMAESEYKIIRAKAVIPAACRVSVSISPSAMYAFLAPV